jgi:hypothetical protein
MTSPAQPSVGPNALLERFNPILVMLPQDFKRKRPRCTLWSRLLGGGKELRGDFHPCKAEFFLSYVRMRRRPQPWIPIPFVWLVMAVCWAFPITIGGWGRSGRVPGLAGALQKSLRQIDPQQTIGWEMDIAPIKSQYPKKAWPTYREMVTAYPEGFVPHAYGYWVRQQGRILLQYWYLYCYNDGANHHEGDWEMAVVEVDGRGEALRAGYSGHASGFQRPWAEVEKGIDGRPLVYVSRGSHAAYFHHKREGHRTQSLPVVKGLRPPIDALVRTAQRKLIDFFWFMRWQDFTATHPDSPGDEPWNQGEFVYPELVIFPQPADEPDNAPFWWMKICCRWGSRHARILGTLAPHPPWGRPRWGEPLAWLDSLAYSQK